MVPEQSIKTTPQNPPTPPTSKPLTLLALPHDILITLIHSFTHDCALLLRSTTRLLYNILTQRDLQFAFYNTFDQKNERPWVFIRDAIRDGAPRMVVCAMTDAGLERFGITGR